MRSHAQKYYLKLDNERNKKKIIEKSNNEIREDSNCVAHIEKSAPFSSNVGDKVIKSSEENVVNDNTIYPKKTTEDILEQVVSNNKVNLKGGEFVKEEVSSIDPEAHSKIETNKTLSLPIEVSKSPERTTSDKTNRIENSSLKNQSTILSSNHTNIPILVTPNNATPSNKSKENINETKLTAMRSSTNALMLELGQFRELNIRQDKLSLLKAECARLMESLVSIMVDIILGNYTNTYRAVFYENVVRNS